MVVARRSRGLAGASSPRLLGWQQLAGHRAARLALGLHSILHRGVCKGRVSLSASRRAKSLDACMWRGQGEKGGVYGEELLEKKSS